MKTKKRTKEDTYFLDVAAMVLRHKGERLRLHQSAEKMRRDIEPTIVEAKGRLSAKHQREWFELRKDHGLELGPAGFLALKGHA